MFEEAPPGTPGEGYELLALPDDLRAHSIDPANEATRLDRRFVVDGKRGKAAVSAGYYEVPREGSIEGVAAALDCSTSTAGELVRKAGAAVLRAHTEIR